VPCLYLSLAIILSDLECPDFVLFIIRGSFENRVCPYILQFKLVRATSNSWSDLLQYGVSGQRPRSLEPSPSDSGSTGHLP